MSSNARAHRRREARNARKVAGLPDAVPAGPLEELPEGQEMAVLPCWAATRADLPEARRVTHDTLIGLMGDQRRGGVRWSEGHGQEAHKMVHGLLDGCEPGEMREMLLQIHQYLEERGGYVVVAMAPGVPPS